MHPVRIAATLFVFGVLTVPAAGASDCILDNCADRLPPRQQRFDRGDNRAYRRSGFGPRGSSRAGSFDYYVLALSWSPGFCELGGARKGREQCRHGADIGFTVHGLWPQYERGFPSDCSGANRFPSREALRTTQGVYPDEGLARYEWRKHGTCSGLSPRDYFSATKQALQSIKIPPKFESPHRDLRLSPLEVERAFTDDNPRLRPGMLAAVCRDNTLEEVRICFTKDLKSFRACPGVVRARCRSQSMTVPALR